MRIYEDRQSKNRQILRDRIDEVYQRAPELTDLDDQISASSLEGVRLLFNGNASAVAHSKANIQRCHDQKINILRSLGYPANYLEQPYDCPDCKDTGFIGTKKCHCFKQLSIDLLYAGSNLDSIIGNDCFDNFDLRYYSKQEMSTLTGVTSYEAAESALQACKDFVQNFQKTGGNILFHGDVGTGKTFLSHCIARELLNQGISVVYFSAAELFDLFAQKAFRREEYVSENYRQVFDCDLLIIDDLGTEYTNNFNASQLFNCLNTRYINQKSVVLSTNLDLEDISATYSQRIFSRVFSNYTIIHLFGEDIRVQRRMATVRSAR